MNELTYIYVLIDPLTNIPRYVGKTSYVEKRLKQHIIEAKCNKKNTHRLNWIRSLLKENLKPILQVVESVDLNQWEEREKFYINLYKTQGFNLINGTPGGDGIGKNTLKGRKLNTPEKLEKIKQTKIKNGTWRQPHSLQTKELISKKNKGSKVSLETKEKRKKTMASWSEEKIKDYNKRRTLKSKEIFQNHNNSIKGKKIEEIYGKNKASEIKSKVSKTNKERGTNKIDYIDQYNLKGKFIKRWKNSKEIVLNFKINAGSLSSCLSGRYKSAGGFVWKRLYTRSSFLVTE